MLDTEEENVSVDRSVDIQEEKSVRQQGLFVIQMGGIKMKGSLTEAEKDFLASFHFSAHVFTSYLCFNLRVR